MKFWGKMALAAAGVTLFVVYAAQLDTRGLGQVFARLGPWLPLVLLPYSLVYFVDTWAWRFAFASPLWVSLGRLFRIRWAGEAVSNVIPSAYLGGELVKVYLLGQQRVPLGTATAAAVVSKSAQTLAQLFFVAAASLVFWQLVPGQAALRIALGTLCLGGLTALALFFWLQRRGLFRSLLGWTERFTWPGVRLKRWRTAAGETDEVIREFYALHPRRFLASAGLYLVGWLLDTVEIFLFAWLSGHSISWPQALVVEAFTGIAKAIGWIIPGSVGVQESGIVFCGRLAGLPDSLCVAYAIFRRGREAGYALAGWGLLATEEGGWAAVRRRRQSSPSTTSS